MTVILGLDPGSLNLGYGVIDARGNRLDYMAHGIISAPRGMSLHLRLAKLYEGLEEIMERHRPQDVSIEKVFSARNPRSALILGHARGMILLSVGRRDLELAEYAPTAVKLSLCGHGRSSKDQVAFMVSRLLSREIAHEGSDSSDALAIAICHAHHRDRRRLLEKISDSGR